MLQWATKLFTPNPVQQTLSLNEDSIFVSLDINEKLHIKNEFLVKSTYIRERSLFMDTPARAEGGGRENFRWVLGGEGGKIQGV